MKKLKKKFGLYLVRFFECIKKLFNKFNIDNI